MNGPGKPQHQIRSLRLYFRTFLFRLFKLLLLLLLLFWPAFVSCLWPSFKAPEGQSDRNTSFISELHFIETHPTSHSSARSTSVSSHTSTWSFLRFVAYTISESGMANHCYYVMNRAMPTVTPSNGAFPQSCKSVLGTVNSIEQLSENCSTSISRWNAQPRCSTTDLRQKYRILEFQKSSIRAVRSQCSISLVLVAESRRGILDVFRSVFWHWGRTIPDSLEMHIHCVRAETELSTIHCRSHTHTYHIQHTAMSLQSRYPRYRRNFPFLSESATTVRQLPLFLPQAIQANVTSVKSISLLESTQPIRMQKKLIEVIDRPEAHKISNMQSISDRSYNIESGSIHDMTEEEQYPVLSFQYVEPHTIELLIVVTEKMRQRFGTLLNDYLTSTMTTVSSLLRHPSLKTSLKLNIVDIILLDRVYASRHNLEDWSHSKQEQVMAKFCMWVNRLRRPNFTWDSAILLNVGHFKSTALGVAHYRSMCSDESACLAVLDRGFGTGYIIAHELGHQLGAKHDFELNSNCGMQEQPLIPDTLESKPGLLKTIHAGSVDDFGQIQSSWKPSETEDIRRDTLMSGTLYFDNFPLRWSACSRQAIHGFLESNVASCLRREDMLLPLYKSDLLARRSQHDLPGAIFSLDQQCQFVLKVHNTRFCGQLLPICRQLYCEDAENGACLPMEAAWAEGSACGENQWCLQGQCVPDSQKPMRVDGSWGQWGQWSACSRKCGGGVRFSERECNNPEPQHGGDFCHGTRTRMRSCVVQSCDEPDEIRQHLCNLVGKNYGTPLEAYIPKLGEGGACSLTCLDNGRAVHHGMTLPDGTRCYEQRDDICIKGRCWETGCDGILGSSLRFDRCRVCGGDNSTCVEITGIYNGDSFNSIGVHPRGLITAVRIPRGVTNAYVWKHSPRKSPFSSDSYDDFMLLIFEELKTQIRRGETREPFAGAELYYSGSRYADEVVSITGRLQKDVNIVIRVENSQTTRPLPTIKYRYFVGRDQRNNPLYFIAEEEAYAQARLENKRAGRSSMLRGQSMVSSIQPSSSNRVDEQDEADNGEDSRHQRPRVHFVWRVSDLPSGCSSCAGNSTSYAECYPLVEDENARKHFHIHDLYRPVAEHLCSSIPRPPPLLRRCADYCGVRWAHKAMSTSLCSARCGEGKRPVAHVCEEFIVPAHESDKTRGLWRTAQLGERACVQAGLGGMPRQPESVACQGTCHPVFWITTNWTECIGNCAYGQRNRELRCQESTGQEWPLGECLAQVGSTTHGTLPEGRITEKVAEDILAKQTRESIVAKMNFEYSESCLSLHDCVDQIAWTTSDWSACEPLNDEMKIICRSVDLGNAYPNPAPQLIGMRTRQVFCHLHTPNIHVSLRQYLQKAGPGPPWHMALDFCRLAHSLVSIPEEPINRESCERPYCYRWGVAKLSECSATCGPGQRTVSVPCERVTLDLLPVSKEQQEPSTLTHWVESVALDQCHEYLGYSPRLFLVGDNQTVHVETIERPFSDADGRELEVTSLSRPIQLNCMNKPCTMRIPVWHTTSWGQCSVSCGQGVRKRTVLCMLETHVQPSAVRSNSQLMANPSMEEQVVTAGRLNAEQTSVKECHDARLPKPAEEETCNEGPCAQWLPDAWRHCDGVCEYGIQRRQVRCVLDISESSVSKPVEVEDTSKSLVFSSNTMRHQAIRKHRSVQLMEVEPERCRGTGPKPAAVRLCLVSNGCPFWFQGEWSRCSVDCGIGQRQRSVSCRFPNGTQVHNVHEDKFSSDIPDWSLNSLTHVVEKRMEQPVGCSAPRPSDETYCKTRLCTENKAFWWPVMASECDSSTCKLGRRKRVIVCLNSLRGPLPDTECNHLIRSKDWTPCVPLTCMRFQWSADAWTPCPETCGVRTRYRRVRCMDEMGEEYSDALCPAHLKPTNWRLCPNKCISTPRSCGDIKQRYPGSKDGMFQLMIGLTLASIYCADMNTESPKEYIVLRKVNFAKTSGFLQPNSASTWCPPASNFTTPDYTQIPLSRSNPSSYVDTVNSTESERLFQREVTSVNCPACPFIPNLASVTYYEKIRVELNALKVEVDDTRFAYTVGSSAVPYGTAKDCFGSQSCPQGRFQIDLRETVFRVSVKTRWGGNKNDAAIHIHRANRGQLVTGHCGGRCCGCWPQPDLLLEVTEDVML